MEDALRRVEGAFSVVAMTRTKLIGVRDPLACGLWFWARWAMANVLASETCALDIIGAELVREIKPGEMVVITQEGIEAISPSARVARDPASLNNVYFSRPDSIVGGRSVYETRESIGRELAKEAPAEADLVCPVPVAAPRRPSALPPNRAFPLPWGSCATNMWAGPLSNRQSRSGTWACGSS